ncbi:unnamed protein product [Staurois parvus]|uniref:Secreted protein n=1 Tax=Staurois parvus TaxID=386267 RepID=A0ABN9AV63_9NEOB|nr:unnamed protein product [Staurois parvus]
MTLSRKGLASGTIKGLTVCCFTVCSRCFVLLCYAEQYKAVCKSWQGRDLYCLHTDLSPIRCQWGITGQDPVIKS